MGRRASRWDLYGGFVRNWKKPFRRISRDKQYCFCVRSRRRSFVFLVLIYYSALIFFISAEVAYSLSARPTYWISKVIDYVRQSGFYRRFPRTVMTFFIFIGIIIVLRALAPDFVRYYINKELRKSSEWQAHAGDVDLAILRGEVYFYIVRPYLAVKIKNETGKKIQLTHMNLSFLSPYLKKNANVGLESGQLELFSELAVREKKIEGYVKPLVTDLKFTDFQKEKEQSFFTAILGTFDRDLKLKPKAPPKK